MKKLIVAAALALVATGLGSASAAPVAWLTDLPQAAAAARAQHKLVLMDFTGSDWCPGCKALKKTVFDSEQFQAYAASNLVMLEVDFPDKKPQPEALKTANAQLRDKYKVDGYPTLVILNSDGKEVGRQDGYEGESIATYITSLEKIRVAQAGAAAGK